MTRGETVYWYDGDSDYWNEGEYIDRGQSNPEIAFIEVDFGIAQVLYKDLTLDSTKRAEQESKIIELIHNVREALHLKPIEDTQYGIRRIP